VGHTIDATGISFTDERIQSILELPLPTTMTPLQSFIGMVNYLRDHLLNIELVIRPLRFVKYTPSSGKQDRLLIWTQDPINSLKEVKTLVENIPKLFFISTTLPIYLNTDASQYDIGAYLYQRRRDRKAYSIPQQILHRGRTQMVCR
jgi:hypothetical protein